MLEPLLWFSLGLAMLLFGADAFLKGASAVALRFGISPFVVGLTIVGFGTSAPELAVNLSAVWRGSYDIALGNVVGSNIANVGLILGACAVVAPLSVHMRMLRIEGPVMVLVGIGLWLLCLDGELGRGDAALLLGGFVAMMLFVARTARDEPADVQQELGEFATAQGRMRRHFGWLAMGLFLLIFGATQMVDAALVLARMWGWSELLIGLTVVAIGTSLPELASSLMAVYRGQNDIAVGNVVGSNLFNMLLILGATGSFHPLPVSDGMQRVELPMMIAFMVLGYVFMHRQGRITRVEGSVLLAAFVAFTLWQASAPAV